MDFKKQLSDYTLKINNALKHYLKIREPKLLFESMNYSMFAGGKRIRPLLMLGILDAYKEDISIALPYCCGIELIHTYSLVHDDLPAMDNDDFRRGKKTNHKEFNEAIAILTGDSFLTLAFEVMLSDCNHDYSKNKLQSILNISKASGAEGMIQGQIIDITSNENMDINTLKLLQDKKTSELIRVSMETGALLSDAKKDDIVKINDLGKAIGNAFQIKDDILDITSTKEVLGKDINSDKKNDKLTYISKYGLIKTISIYEKLEKEILNSLEDIFSKDCFLYFLVLDLLKRTK